MSLFLEWNSLLLEEYFSPTKAGEDIWISTTRAELEGIGVHKGGASGLIEAVKEGPPWFYGPDNIAIKAKELAKQRRDPYVRGVGYSDPEKMSIAYLGVSAPTYLPYIALWVLARSEVNTGFYAKVSELIGSDFPSNMGKEMEFVWIDLERWCNKNKGSFGRFKVNVLGENRFVGIAHAQALITNKDIDGLARLFGSCRLLAGQELNNEDFSRLLEYGKESNYLSSGLKGAMNLSSYSAHLKRLLTYYLEFWDGKIPKRIKNSIDTSKGHSDEDLTEEDASVVLQLKSYDESDAWEIGWRVPALLAGAGYQIKVGSSSETKAKLELAGTHVCATSDVNQSVAREILNNSYNTETIATLSCVGSGGLRNERQFILKQTKIRFFVWDQPDPTLDNTLVEREMPLVGDAFFLYSRKSYSNLRRILENNFIKHEPYELSGLPDDWSLIYVSDIEKLTPEQRAEIADEEISATTKARVRFVGGKPIIGGGSKKYAYYDLPVIELEAPAGTEIISKGMLFKELFDVQKTSVRRFSCAIGSSNASVFRIEATFNDEVLCRAGLQVLAVGGLASTTNETFSIDKFGRAQLESTGLNGAYIGGSEATTPEIDVQYFKLGDDPVSETDLELLLCRFKTNISSLFLDSLATTINGSMTFGVARDLIRRLANNASAVDVEPALLLRRLRRRGIIEIETDVKGHMVRVYAVKPTLYSIPMRDSDGNQLYGICGSLRLQQWSKLLQLVDCYAFLEEPKDFQSLPIVRISSPLDSSLVDAAEAINLQVVILPSVQVCSWLGCLDQVKSSLKWYPESGLEPAHLKRLSLYRGVFNSDENMLIDKSLRYELIKHQDQQITGLNVYKVGRNRGNGFSEYSFIQDSRWGIWLAINAFAKMLKKEPYNITDASPWPFPYDFKRGDLWVPARMEFPYVIERVLALCSSNGPEVHYMDGEMEGESIVLREGVRVSRVYDGMKKGRWLCYQYVPQAIASHIASLLSGELREIKDVESEYADKGVRYVG